MSQASGMGNTSIYSMRSWATKKYQASLVLKVGAGERRSALKLLKVVRAIGCQAAAEEQRPRSASHSCTFSIPYQFRKRVSTAINGSQAITPAKAAQDWLHPFARAFINGSLEAL